MSEPMITGYTAQLSGPPILCDQGLADDRAWFERHHGRRHRIRKPLGGEVAALSASRAELNAPPRSRPCVLVRQLKPGARIRLLTFVLSWPLNSEAEAARLFARSAECWPEVEAIEVGVREGRL